jgi:hypothetical protein
MVSFFTRRPVIERRGHHGRQLAAHDQPHDVQHLVVEDLAVLDGALQRFLGGDGHGVLLAADRVGLSVKASLRPKAMNMAPAARSSQCMPRCTAPARHPGRGQRPAGIDGTLLMLNRVPSSMKASALFSRRAR